MRCDAVSSNPLNTLELMFRQVIATLIRNEGVICSNQIEGTNFSGLGAFLESVSVLETRFVPTAFAH